jgi:hypothetical protein
VGKACFFALASGLFAMMPSAARAARARPIFEPTDLEMEAPGVAEFDLQVGAIRGDTPWRLVVPDAEVDIGLWPQVELDIDGAYAIEGPDDGAFVLDHPAPDNLWVAAKVAFWDVRDDAGPNAWALGAQLGPKIPVAKDAHGTGYEALLLLGRTWGESHFVFNGGGLVDPGTAISTGRPTGIEGGVDAELDLWKSGFSLTGELGAVHFVSSDPDQLHVTAGLTFAVTDKVDVSVVGLLGLLSGGDQRGILFGFSPKLDLTKK